jgi:hypothetical protein
VDRSTFLRAAVIQTAAVIALALALGLALPHSFFEVWGWIAGPATWLLCSAITARVLGLDLGVTLLGALLAGVVSGVAVLVGVHWLGVALAIGLFAAWCGRLVANGGRVAWT